MYPVEATRSGYCHPMDFTSLNIEDYHYSTANDKMVSSSEMYHSFAWKSISYDHFLDVFGEEDIKKFLVKVQRLVQEVSSIEKDDLTTDQLIDLKLLGNQLQLELIKWGRVKHHQKDPSLYVPFDAVNYLLPTWGSWDATPPGDNEEACQWAEFVRLSHPGVTHLPPSLRLVSLLSRLRHMPACLSEGRVNLIHPVKAFVERAITQCDNLVAFLELDFEMLVLKIASYDKSSGADLLNDLVKEIELASQVASRSLVSFKAFLENDLLPLACEDVSIGREMYDQLLALGQMIPDSSQILEIGHRYFDKVKLELEEIAAGISPGKTWQQITEELIRPNHPSSSNLLQAYMDEILRSKHHMIERDLIPELPHNEQVMGVYTPPTLIPFSPFGDFLNPSPFAGMAKKSSAKAHTGYLMLHPVGVARGVAPSEEERLLRSHDYSWIKVIAPHECYPGHHVQTLLAQKNPRLLRKYLQSTYFYEGWGLYCEQLAYETGFFEIPENEELHKPVIPASYTRLTQLRLQLWRATRIILDIRLHRGEMTLQECREFLCKEVMFDPLSTQGEVMIYASQPGYAPCYVTGLHKLLELRERERELCLVEGREFKLRAFHGKVLEGGALPFALLEKSFTAINN